MTRTPTSTLKQTPGRFPLEANLFFRRILSLGFFAVLLAAPVFAQEGGGDIADSPSGWVFRWLNFAIVFGAIAYCAVKFGGPHFRKQSEEISQKIAEGARAREAADRQRQAAQAKLAGIGAEVAQIRADAKRSGEAEAVRLRALARDEAETIARAAQAEIAAAQRAARLELKTLAARLAIERAESLLQQQITASADASLFAAFIGDLDRSAN
jgi:F-type H+-transporting ATPase subunit b